jgi:hypothetical protein
MSLQIRRGTDAQRQAVTFDLGEIVYTTDTKKLFIGDGATLGGVNVLSNSAGTGLTWNSTTQTLNFSGTLSGYTTDNLAQGTVNLYYSPTRAKADIATMFTATGSNTTTGTVTSTTATTISFVGAVSTINGVGILTYTSGTVPQIGMIITGTGINASPATYIVSGTSPTFILNQVPTAAGTGVAIQGVISLVTVSSATGLVALEPFIVASGGQQGGLTNATYYIVNPTAGSNQISLASTLYNAQNGIAITNLTTATLSPSANFTAGGPDSNINFTYNSTTGTMAVNSIGVTAVSQDSAPSLGGNLTLNTKNITGTGNISITGNLTASGTLSVPKLAANLNIDTYSITGNSSTVLLSSTSTIMTVGNAALPEMRLYGSQHTIQSQTSQSILTLQSSIGATPGTLYTANTDVSYLNFKAWSISGSVYKQLSTVTVSVDGNIGGTNDLPGRIVLAVGGQANGTQQYLALNSYGYLAGPLGLTLTALTNATTAAFAAGAVYLPAASVNGTIIYNSDAGCIQAYINGAFRNFVSYSSAAPASSKGASGDRKGMVFATSAYVYTCYADYTNGTPDIWARTATTGSTF